MTPRPIDLRREQVRDDFCSDDYRTPEEIRELQKMTHAEKLAARLPSRRKDKKEDAAS